MFARRVNPIFFQSSLSSSLAPLLPLPELMGVAPQLSSSWFWRFDFCAARQIKMQNPCAVWAVTEAPPTSNHALKLAFLLHEDTSRMRSARFSCLDLLRESTASLSVKGESSKRWIKYQPRWLIHLHPDRKAHENWTTPAEQSRRCLVRLMLH